MLFYLALIISGVVALAYNFFVIAEEERERLVLAFFLVVAGSGAIAAGILGLLIQSLMHYFTGRKEPNQTPQPTVSGRGSS